LRSAKGWKCLAAWTVCASLHPRVLTVLDLALTVLYLVLTVLYLVLTVLYLVLTVLYVPSSLDSGRGWGAHCG